MKVLSNILNFKAISLTLETVLFICLFSVQVGFGQARTEFVVADSGITPAVCDDQRGGAYVVWRSLRSDDGIYISHIDSSGANVFPARRIGRTEACYDPDIIADSNGVFTIWRNIISNHVSFMNSYIDGCRLEDAQTDPDTSEHIRLNDSFADAERGSPKIRPLTYTSMFAAWVGEGTETPSRKAPYGQRLGVNGAKIGENLLLSDHYATSSRGPGITTPLSGGAGLVTWVDNSRGHYDLYGRTIATDGHLGAHSIWMSVDSLMTDMYYYAVAVLPTGGYVATWSAFKETLSQIEVCWYDSLGNVSVPIQQVTRLDTLVTFSSTAIATTNDGNTVLLWEQPTELGTRLFGRAYDRGGHPLGGIFRLTKDSVSVSQYSPRVIVQNGMLTVIWSETQYPLVKPFDILVKGMKLELSQLTGVEERPENKWEQVHAFKLLPCYPNPFNPTTTIRFTMASPGHVTVCIWNTLGLREAVLLDEGLSPGTHEVTWDGKTSNGTPLPSGTYFVSVRVGGEVQVSKLMLLR